MLQYNLKRVRFLGKLGFGGEVAEEGTSFQKVSGPRIMSRSLVIDFL